MSVNGTKRPKAVGPFRSALRGKADYTLGSAGQPLMNRSYGDCFICELWQTPLHTALKRSIAKPAWR